MEYSISLFSHVHFQSKGCHAEFLALPFITETPVFDTNSADSDQKPRSASALLANAPFMDASINIG